MSISEFVRRSGGIVRSRAVRDRGWSDRAIARAVADGALLRPREGWLAVPDADADLLRAARAGVVLSCVTQATRLGLWVLRQPALPHVAASPNSGRVRVEKDASRGRSAAVVHWNAPLVPRPPFSLIDPIENVLAAVAHCLPFDEALTIWNSALNQELTALPVLRRMPLRSAARALADAATPYADSGLETLIARGLAWMRLPLRSQIWIAGHRVDFLVGDRLVLQVDGGSHVGAQRESDNRHDVALMLFGYHVIRVGYRQIVHDWPSVQDQIMRAVAQGLHRAA